MARASRVPRWAQRPIESRLDHAHGRKAAAAGVGHRRGGKDRQGMMLEQLERQLPADWEEQRVIKGVATDTGQLTGLTSEIVEAFLDGRQPKRCDWLSARLNRTPLG